MSQGTNSWNQLSPHPNHELTPKTLLNEPFEPQDPPITRTRIHVVNSCQIERGLEAYYTNLKSRETPAHGSTSNWEVRQATFRNRNQHTQWSKHPRFQQRKIMLLSHFCLWLYYKKSFFSLNPVRLDIWRAISTLVLMWTDHLKSGLAKSLLNKSKVSSGPFFSDSRTDSRAFCSINMGYSCQKRSTIFLDRNRGFFPSCVSTPSW